MVHNPPTWVKGWMLISTLLVFWDAGYCLSRPHSFHGGKYHHWWSPYKLYEVVDLVYGSAAFDRGDGFTSAQAILNLVENFLNLTYLALAGAGNSSAVLVGFTAVVCTFWKTTLYWLMDQQCGWCQTGHNDMKTWLLLFALPNGFWLVMPATIAYLFGSEIARDLRAVNAVKSKKSKKA